MKRSRIDEDTHRELRARLEALNKKMSRGKKPAVTSADQLQSPKGKKRRGNAGESGVTGKVGSPTFKKYRIGWLGSVLIPTPAFVLVAGHLRFAGFLDLEDTASPVCLMYPDRTPETSFGGLLTHREV